MFTGMPLLVCHCVDLISCDSKFRLLPETIFLATNIVDRFLSIRTVSLVKFQLVGVTALFIAAKYEEIVCPSISSFLYMTDGGYTDEEILKAERYMLQMIGYDLSYPNPINFLRRISKADQYDVNSRTVAKYFMEMACVDRRFMQYPPSILAAAACWLSRKVLDRGEWDCNLVHYVSCCANHRISKLTLLIISRPTLKKSFCLVPNKCSTLSLATSIMASQLVSFLYVCLLAFSYIPS